MLQGIKGAKELKVVSPWASNLRQRLLYNRTSKQFKYMFSAAVATGLPNFTTSRSWTYRMKVGGLEKLDALGCCKVGLLARDAVHGLSRGLRK